MGEIEAGEQDGFVGGNAKFVRGQARHRRAALAVQMS
jgi:hypothetical protein